MRLHSLSPGEWGKTLAIGVGVAILTGAITFMGLRTGVSPLPKPLALAFAETLFGRTLPLPVGMLFHVAWVTFFSAVYVALFREALTFMRAFGLGFALWVLTLLFFFPVVGWGFLGLAVTPMLIIASAVSHLLFVIFLWGLCKLSFSHEDERSAGHGSHDQAAP